MVAEGTASRGQRRLPVQERSRETVRRILDAAAVIIDEEGVDAASTRSIADRAGVAYPSLYRFFKDRDEILDSLIERHLTQLDALAAETEPTWTITSATDLISAEFDLHVDYYRRHPNAARIWMGGRTSPLVAEKVHARIRRVADQVHAQLVGHGLIPADTDPLAFLVVAEIIDRVLELAYRDGREFDETLLALGRTAALGSLDRLIPEA